MKKTKLHAPPRLNIHPEREREIKVHLPKLSNFEAWRYNLGWNLTENKNETKKFV